MSFAHDPQYLRIGFQMAYLYAELQIFDFVFFLVSSICPFNRRKYKDRYEFYHPFSLSFDFS